MEFTQIRLAHATDDYRKRRARHLLTNLDGMPHTLESLGVCNGFYGVNWKEVFPKESVEKEIHGINGFHKDWKQYEITFTPNTCYHHDGKLEFCKSGFHFCKWLHLVFIYRFMATTAHICRVVARGKILQGLDKYVCSDIEILDELSGEEICEIMDKELTALMRSPEADHWRGKIEQLMFDIECAYLPRYNKGVRRKWTSRQNY